MNTKGKIIKISKDEIRIITDRLSELAIDSKKWQKEFSNPNSWMNEIVYQVVKGRPVAKVLREAILQGGGSAVYRKRSGCV